MVHFLNNEFAPVTNVFSSVSWTFSLYSLISIVTDMIGSFSLAVFHKLPHLSVYFSSTFSCVCCLVTSVEVALFLNLLCVWLFIKLCVLEFIFVSFVYSCNLADSTVLI